MQLSDILPRLLQTFGYNELLTNYVRYRYEAHHKKTGLKIFGVAILKGMTIVIPKGMTPTINIHILQSVSMT